MPGDALGLEGEQVEALGIVDGHDRAVRLEHLCEGVDVAGRKRVNTSSTPPGATRRTSAINRW
jgi:hypothetical protein